MAFGAGVLVGAALLNLLPSALSAAATWGGPKAAVFLIAALGGLLIFYLGEVAAHHSGSGLVASGHSRSLSA